MALRTPRARASSACASTETCASSTSLSFRCEASSAGSVAHVDSRTTHSVLDGWDDERQVAFVMLGVRDRLVRHEELGELATVLQQYGGLSCLQAAVTGLIFRIEDAPRIKDVRPLLNGLAGISDSHVSPLFPEASTDERIAQFGDTRGEPLDAHRLSTVVSDYVRLPPFRAAREALAESAPVQPGVLRGWPTWAPNRAAAPMNDTQVDQLIALCAHTGAPLAVYLLWSNSD